MSKKIIFLYSLCIVFMHFSLFRVIHFEFTLLFLFHFIATIVFFLKIGYKKLIVFVLLLVLPLINIIWQDFDTNEFIRSYLLYILWTSSILVISNLINSDNSIFFFRSLIKLLAFVGMFSIIQVVFFVIFKSDLFYNIFGNHTYLYQYKLYYDFGKFGIPRANAFFLEPSVNGRMLSLGIALFFFTKGYFKINRIYIVFIVLGIIATRSASAILQSCFIVLVWILIISTKKKLVTLIPLLIIGLLLFIDMLGITERILEINRIGTSGYYRIKAPLLLTFEIFKSHPLGFPLGSIESIISTKSYMAMGNNQGSSLDNSIITLIFNFGIIGLFLNAYLIIRIIKDLLNKNKVAIIGVFLFFTLLGTGALYTPEIALAIIIYILSIKFLKYEKQNTQSIVY